MWLWLIEETCEATCKGSGMRVFFDVSFDASLQRAALPA
jgi:hypothetical protein